MGNVFECSTIFDKITQFILVEKIRLAMRVLDSTSAKWPAKKIRTS